MIDAGEPTIGLDPQGMREMREFIRALGDGGKTVFLSSHLLYEVEQICDRVAILREGKVIAYWIFWFKRNIPQIEASEKDLAMKKNLELRMA